MRLQCIHLHTCISSVYILYSYIDARPIMYTLFVVPFCVCVTELLLYMWCLYREQEQVRQSIIQQVMLPDARERRT